MPKEIQPNILESLQESPGNRPGFNDFMSD